MTEAKIQEVRDLLNAAVVELKGDKMKSYDNEKLDSDLLVRYQYLADFMGFGEEDLKAINGAAPILAQLVPDITAAVYRKLFSYSNTKKYFLQRNEGFTGELASDMEHLGMEHEQINMRRMILGKYLGRLVTTSVIDLSFVKYLDYVGKVHTPKAGAQSINIPLLHMNALMGFINDALTIIVINLGLTRDQEITLIRAFTKLLWIQEEFITKHY